jgi:glycosyltransferase involved in cell wall biosynthesis
MSDAHRTRYRVMMLTDSLDVGGLERVVISLSRSLNERGHSLTVVAEPGGALWDDLPETVDRWAAPPRRTTLEKARYFLWLTWRLRSGKFDIVHAHQRGVALQARAARTLTKTRVVEHVHNVFVPTRSRWLSFRGDRLIACGRAIAEMLVNDFHRSARAVTAIPNAVGDLGAGESLTLPTSRGDQLPTIVVIGRVTEQKDPHRFIDVISLLNAGIQRVEALWVGDGELLDQCVDEVNRRGVQGISFVGAHADVVPFLRRADLVMLTSRWEGLPLVLLEAASMGRGLVAPRVGSCAEAVDDTANGLLFDADSEPETIAALVEKALDAETLRAMGSASRRKYVSQFRLDSQILRVEEVYRAALAR